MSDASTISMTLMAVYIRTAGTSSREVVGVQRLLLRSSLSLFRE